MGSGWEGEDGDEDRKGIIPRAIRDLFAGADARAETAREQGQLPPEFSVQAQFIELYNEDIVDLLDPAKDPYAKVWFRSHSAFSSRIYNIVPTQLDLSIKTYQNLSSQVA